MSKSSQSNEDFLVGYEMGQLIAQTGPGQQVVAGLANGLAQTGASAVAAGTAFVAVAAPIVVAATILGGLGLALVGWCKVIRDV